MKEAIKLYSEQHPQYKAKLGSDLEAELYGKKPEKGPDGNPPPTDDKSKFGTIALIAGAVVGAGGLGYMALKKDSKKESKI